jgi:hypothetical protein
MDCYPYRDSGLNMFNTRAPRARTKRSGQGNHPAALALKWLALDETGAGVMAMAQNLMQAEQVVRKALPPVLAQSCRVANLDRQCLTLAVPAAAHATRLRQLKPTLLRAMTAAGWNLTDVEIRVQAGLAGQNRPAPPREVRPLDRPALECFRELQESVAPGPLADAIQKLLVHHGAGKG